MPSLRTTHRLTVTEDMIDHLGHMNVLFYGRAALIASGLLCDEVGGHVVVAPVDLYTRHFHEQLLGAELEVRSLVLGGGEGSLRLYHELRNRETDELAASFVHRLEGRTDGGVVAAWPPGAPSPERHIPESGRPRTIDLQADPMLNAPTFDQVRGDEALALRHPRTVEEAECVADGTFDPGLAPMLIWGGNPLDDTDGPILHDGPNGEKIGWANMENRCVMLRLPRAGDRIQSFGATVQVLEKNIHHILWAYDVDRGDLLMAMELVDLAFDTISRRAVPLPDARRRQAEERLRPQYAPS